MKTKIFLLLFMSFLISFGQSNNLLVDANKLWSNLKSADGGGPPPHYKQTNFIKFEGDTVIGSNQFKNVFESLDSLHQNWSLIGFIREDLSKKVYYLPIQNSIERLLYDFNATIGDTVNTWIWGITPVEMVVTNIDYIYVYNKYVKCLTLSSFGINGEKWIENIGSSEGILAPGAFSLTGLRYDLLCYYENDTLKYSNPNFSYCYINDVGIDVKQFQNIKVKIFPNPVTSTSTLIIENSPYNDYILEIYSILGEKIKTISNIKNKKIMLNKSDFISGIYFYRLLNADKNIMSGKFSVE